jgi:Cytochrome c7 and related cytochrome c
VPVPVPVAEPRRIEPPTMGLGGNPGALKASSLDEMFASFKAKQQAGEFSHSDIETGFGLTGKHLKIECASCHNKPLPATRQNTVARTCLSCHEKDDNHSGRRPDCAKCHTTNRWKQRIR